MTKRSVATVVILALATLGIYFLARVPIVGQAVIQSKLNEAAASGLAPARALAA